jgi:SAM-dependent methyltransferase
MYNILERNLSLYKRSIDSDYWVYVDGNMVPTQNTIMTHEETGYYRLIGDVVVYANEFIERLSPDNIDSCEFWSLATKNFPLFSIAGGLQKFTTKEEVNNATLQMSAYFGALIPIFESLGNNTNPMILEIGVGHGGFHQFLTSSHDKNYYGIDVCPLYDHPRVYKCDGRNIPNTIPNPMDMVYSMNVFQHLSKRQRSSYYKQIYLILKTGGFFVFGMFVVTEKNKSWPCWGIRGENDKNYCTFFRQLTEVDSEIEVLCELQDLGFYVEKLSTKEKSENYLTFKCTKL